MARKKVENTEKTAKKTVKKAVKVEKAPEQAIKKLKPKYNGIYFKGKLYRNGDLTQKDVDFLEKEHPAGKMLFV